MIPNPVLIDSTIEFVIVGPLALSEGVLIRSTEVSTKILGSAYALYSNKNNIPHDLTLILKKIKVRHIWVEINNGTVNRKYSILFCWKMPTTESLLARDNTIKSRIEHELKNFTIETNRFFIDSQNSVGSPTFLADHYTNVITWRISPVLFECEKAGSF